MRSFCDIRKQAKGLETQTTRCLKRFDAQPSIWLIFMAEGTLKGTTIEVLWLKFIDFRLGANKKLHCHKHPA